MQLSTLKQDAEIQQLHRSEGTVLGVIQAAVQLCRSKAADKQIGIENYCLTDLKAMMDSDLMEQAVVNLLDNAIKYSSNGSCIHIMAAQADQEVIITVRDEGIGVSKKHRPRLFERFYRVDKARSRQMGGTGLGLAIVKHIMQAHGGQVTVRSAQGEGSSFTLHLPDKSSTRPALGADAPQDPMHPIGC